jgi:hypothetical protein
MSKHFIQQPLGKASSLTAEEWGIPDVTMAKVDGALISRMSCSKGHYTV